MKSYSKHSLWWWQDQAVHAVNDTVSAKDVDGYDTGVEVDSQTAKGDLEGNTLGLWFRAEMLALQKGWGSVAREHTSSRVEARKYVVGHNSLELLLARLRGLLGDLLKSLTCVSQY